MSQHIDWRERKRIIFVSSLSKSLKFGRQVSLECGLKKNTSIDNFFLETIENNLGEEEKRDRRKTSRCIIYKTLEKEIPLYFHAVVPVTEIEGVGEVVDELLRCFAGKPLQGCHLIVLPNLTNVICLFVCLFVSVCICM